MKHSWQLFKIIPSGSNNVFVHKCKCCGMVREKYAENNIWMVKYMDKFKSYFHIAPKCQRSIVLQHDRMLRMAGLGG